MAQTLIYIYLYQKPPTPGGFLFSKNKNPFAKKQKCRRAILFRPFLRQHQHPSYIKNTPTLQ